MRGAHGADGEVIELLGGFLLGHPGWSLALAGWTVASGLVLLTLLGLARAALRPAHWAAAGLALALAWRMLREEVASGGRTRRTWRGRHSALYTRHVTRQSPAWRTLRERVLARAQGRCEGCGRSTAALAAHHLHYRTLGHESLRDLKALCSRCHSKAHPGRRKAVGGGRTRR